MWQQVASAMFSSLFLGSMGGFRSQLGNTNGRVLKLTLKLTSRFPYFPDYQPFRRT